MPIKLFLVFFDYGCEGFFPGAGVAELNQQFTIMNGDRHWLASFERARWMLFARNSLTNK
jgi:hypothetical protein